MAKIRVLGRRGDAERVIRLILDLGLVHLAPAPADIAPLHPLTLNPRQRRHRRYLESGIGDVEAVFELLRYVPLSERARSPRPGVRDWSRWLRLARRSRRNLESENDRRISLEKERARLSRFVGFAEAFIDLAAQSSDESFGTVSLVVPSGDVASLRSRLESTLGAGVEMRTQPIDGGEVAVVVLLPNEQMAAVERQLSEDGILDLRLPIENETGSLRQAAPQLRQRIDRIDQEIADIESRRSEATQQLGPELAAAKAAMVDRLREIDALTHAAASRRSFVLEGWLPESSLPVLRQRLNRTMGENVVVEEVEAEDWRGEDAPVVLHNPRIFRPFEAITGLVPLPRYGTIDPTPFVGVFFPVFFGLILGDVGYGSMLIAASAALRRRSRPESRKRAVAQIGIACGACTLAFGVAYGELFGDLGRHYFGMMPLLLDREEALLPFLGLTVALGFVHVLLGLILGMIGGARGSARRTVGRGLAASMVLLIGLALLAALDKLPEQLLTPTVVSILVLFPILIILEGIIAPIELLSTFSNILSYARIMALGTASVMMAVVANRMAGAMGSIVVGTLFALLFHLVNFALGVFAPTIHSLRLHYVEFFGKFVSPGGIRYEPLRHWQPGEEYAD